MALEINRNPEKDDMPKPYISDRRLYLDASQTRVVEEGDAEARYVFAGAGSEITAEDAQRLGLKHEGGKVVLAKGKAVESGEPSGTIKKPVPTNEADAERYWGAEKLRGVMFASGSAREKAKHAKLMTEDFEGETPEIATGFTESQVQKLVDSVGSRNALEALQEERGFSYAGVPDPDAPAEEPKPAEGARKVAAKTAEPRVAKKAAAPRKAPAKAPAKRAAKKAAKKTK